MTPQSVRQPVEGAVIEGLTLVDQITRNEAVAFQSVSTPGHLIHLVTQGEVTQDVSGHVQKLCPGTVVWYHESEPIRGRIDKVPWTFYNVSFLAPRLAPPNQRVMPAAATTELLFNSLLEIWRNDSAPPLARHLRLFAKLMELIVEILPSESQANRIDAPTQLWWDIEARLREDLSLPIDLTYLQKLSRRSERSIVRACHLAVGTSPMKRVKKLRLQQAQGLVQYSKLSITEIAMRVGYAWVQELSRDYQREFGTTPSQDRRTGPDYHTLFPANG